MLNQLICHLKRLSDKNNAGNEDELLYQALAQCCLQTGKKAPYFQFEYQKHLVLEAKKMYPDYSYVRLSIVTGLNRRTISEIIKGKSYLKYSDKIDLLKNYLISYCHSHKTQRVLKKGECDSFEYFCTVVANGTLTSASMAEELLEKGEIINKGRYYYLSSLHKKNNP